ncbi:MAG: hypothetical protein J6B24_12155 [Clostridia bacterium]|nr:hypothetical protein [Clostridia bacterium]
MNKRYGDGTFDDYLPQRLSRSTRKEAERVTAFGGCSTPFGGGDLIAKGENLSPRRAPCPASRLPRGLFHRGQGIGNPNGMVWFDGCLVFVRGTELYSTADGLNLHRLGTVSDTPKSFAVFGGRLYIYPDKLRMDSGLGMPTPLDLDVGTVENAVIEGNTVTLPQGQNWERLGFEAGDCLRIINEDDVTPAPSGYFHIVKLWGQVATLAAYFDTTYTSTVRFRREVPALESVCVCGDRVYGIIGREAYVSAAGSATDFYSYSDGEGYHPVILKSESEGDFTALAPWQGYVVFFKEDRICKLLGSRSDSLTLHDNGGVGLPKPLAKSLCEVGGALYYASHGGVYRYRGQEAERVSDWGGETVTAACGGSDGEAYYLSVAAGDGARTSLFLPDRGEWYPEDDLAVAHAARKDGFVFFQDGEGRIWKTSSDGRKPACSFSEEMVKGIVTSSVTFIPDHFGEPDGYRLMGVCIRATGSAGGSLRVRVRYGEDPEEVLLGEFAGGMEDRLLRIPVHPRPCDGSVLRLEMRGEWVIHAVTREYERLGQ